MSERIISGVWEYEKTDDEKATITGYIGDETDIIVPREIDGMAVACIGEKAFFKKNITSIKLPDTLSYIGFRAFAHCKKLISVELPDTNNKLYIELCAFSFCSNLESINLSEAVIVWHPAFTGCRKFIDEKGFLVVRDVLYKYYGKEKDVVIPRKVSYVGEGAFENNKNITSVRFEGKIRRIDLYAFTNCTNLSSVVLQNSGVTIKDCAFKNCPGLADKNGFVIVDENLCEYLGDKSDVTVPYGVRVILRGAFSNKTNLASVTLPASLACLDRQAFKNCPKLMSIKIEKSALEHALITHDAFYRCPIIANMVAFITLVDTESDSE